MESTKILLRHYPISHYWRLVKNMDDKLKMQLITMLVDSIKTNEAGRKRKKKALDAIDYAGIWSDEEYIDADELVDVIRNARQFKNQSW